MMTVFDQEKVWEIERYNIAKENREEGIKRERRRILHEMLKRASLTDVSRLTGYSPEEIKRITADPVQNP